MIIENGAGNGNKLAVNGANEAKVFSVTKSQAQDAADLGNAFNINTGDITCAGDTTICYFKNDEDTDVILEAFAVGLRGSTVADLATVTFITNPTAGDLISDATDADMTANRKAGSSKVLKSTTLAYKGKVSGTVTGGVNAAQFYMGNNSRLFATINWVISRGSSIAIKITDTTTAGNLYGALILHKKDDVR